VHLTDSVLNLKKSLFKDWGSFIHELMLGGPLGKYAEEHVLRPMMQTAGSTTHGDTNIQIDVSGAGDPMKAAEEMAKKLNKVLSDRFYHQGTQKR
jgi:hypothetical protein